MSGGHFDYNCFKISQFAEELRHEIETNDTPRGDSDYAPRFSEETLAILKHCHDFIERAGDYAKEIEWLYSGDHGEDTFTEFIKQIGMKKTRFKHLGVD